MGAGSGRRCPADRFTAPPPVLFPLPPVVLPEQPCAVTAQEADGGAGGGGRVLPSGHEWGRGSQGARAPLREPMLGAPPRLDGRKEAGRCICHGKRGMDGMWREWVARGWKEMGLNHRAGVIFAGDESGYTRAGGYNRSW